MISTSLAHRKSIDFLYIIWFFMFVSYRLPLFIVDFFNNTVKFFMMFFLIHMKNRFHSSSPLRLEVGAALVLL